jgi:hypothetical protein
MMVITNGWNMEPKVTQGLQKTFRAIHLIVCNGSTGRQALTIRNILWSEDVKTDSGVAQT